MGGIIVSARSRISRVASLMSADVAVPSERRRILSPIFRSRVSTADVGHSLALGWVMLRLSYLLVEISHLDGQSKGVGQNS